MFLLVTLGGMSLFVGACVCVCASTLSLRLHPFPWFAERDCLCVGKRMSADPYCTWQGLAGRQEPVFALLLATSPKEPTF